MTAGESGKAIEIEGWVTALNVVRVLTPDVAAVRAAIQSKVEEAPGVFRGTGLVIDLTAIEPAVQEHSSPAPLPRFALAELVEWLKQAELLPVAGCAHGEQRKREAAEAGLVLIDAPARPSSRGAPRKPRATTNAQDVAAALAKSDPAPAAAAASAPNAEPPVDTGAAQPFLNSALTLTQPLRAGQILYAKGRDAIALAAVNAGAELIADGNIHVYGPLRGRALAGARGNEQARIFCSKLEADLISIAGVYLSAEALPQDKRGKAVQIFLEDGELVFAELPGR
jgi:septum site-determining protein MinC